MKFVFYTSLKPAAKRAFDKGSGDHGRFIVDGQYIAAKAENGRAMDFIKVVKGHGPVIEELKP